MARPGWRNFAISPPGSGLSPFQENAATIYTIANTGAMLLFGQERSRGNAALAAEPRCARDSNWEKVLRGHRDLSESFWLTQSPRRGGPCFYRTFRDLAATPLTMLTSSRIDTELALPADNLRISTEGR